MCVCVCLCVCVCVCVCLHACIDGITILNRLMLSKATNSDGVFVKHLCITLKVEADWSGPSNEKVTRT